MKNLVNRFQVQLSVLILILGLTWIAITSIYFDTNLDNQTFAPAEGFPAPDFSLNTIDGKPFKLSTYKNQVILVNFWASWCPPCKTEMPTMQSVYDIYKDKGFIILAVDAANQDDINNVKRFSSKHLITFPILLDTDGTITNKYHVRSFPTSFFIDGSGVIHEIVIGGPMSEALLKTRVEALIGAK